MAFIEERFPLKVGMQAEARMIWSTDVVRVFGGQRQSNRNWSDFLWEFNIPTISTKEEMHLLLLFFAAVAKGQANEFRFKNWEDFQARQFPAENRPSLQGETSGLLTGNGSETRYQLIRTYQYGTQVFYKKITKPVHNGIPVGTNTLSVYLDDSLLPFDPSPSPTDDADLPAAGKWKVNHTTGIITFGTAPAIGTIPTWDGEFDTPVELMDDSSRVVSLDPFNRSWKGIKLREVRIV